MSSTVKNWIIILLCLVIAGQAWLLRDRFTNAFQEGPRIQSISLDSPMRTTITVEFNRPAPESALKQEHPAEIRPETEGQWVWANPYTLKFLSQTSLPLNMAYEVRLNQDLFGEDMPESTRTARIQTGEFAVREFSMNEMPSEAGPAMVELEGKLSFNAPVDPQNLLEAMRLTEANGTAIDVFLQTSWRTRDFVFRSAPILKEKDARTLTLRLAPELIVAEKNLSLGREFLRGMTVVLDPVLKVVNLTPDSGPDQSQIVMEFSAPVQADKIREYMKITPDIQAVVSTHGRTATITGRLEPGKKYEVALSRGLTAADGASLNESYRTAVTIPDLPPGVDFSAKGMFLPRQGQGLIGLEYVNTDELVLTVSRVFPNNLSALFQDHGYAIFSGGEDESSVPYHLGSEIYRKSFSLQSAPNKKEKRTISMSELVPDNRPGLYKLNLTLPSEYQGATRWVLRTNIGLMAKAWDGGYMIWANSIDSLRPMRDLEVALISSKNQILASARTDETGLARFSRPAQNDEMGYPTMIVAWAREDFSFLMLDHFGIDTTGLDVSGTSVNAAGLQAYVYGKRDIYRPGETLDAAILIRNAQLQEPPSAPLTLEQSDPEGRVLRTLKLIPNQGMATVSLDIPDWSLTGRYSLNVMSGGESIGTYAYQVEEFIPDRISVEIAKTPRQADPGQRFDFNVVSHYLFGPPAANLAVSTKIRLIHASFTPKGFEAYTFGDPGRTFEPMPLLAADSRLDAEGQGNFTAAIPENLTPPLALQAEITSRVQEQGGRGVTARTYVPVHAYSLYPGIKQPESMEFEPRKKAVFEFVTVNADGVQTQNPELIVTLFQDRWQTVMRKSDTGVVYESVRNPIEVSTQSLPAGLGKGSFEVVPQNYGSYRVRLTDPKTGALAEQEFYCGGWGYSPWAVKNPARLELIPDKEGYRGGETASIQLRAPFAGKALICVEGQGVKHHQIVELAGNTGQVSIPVSEAWQPNVYVTAILVRKGTDIRPGTPGRAFGAIPLFVDSLSNKMAVRVDAPAEVRPQTDLAISLTARPHSRVTVSVVDEGILQLAGGKNPDPFGFFYAKRALEVNSLDSFAMLFPYLSAAKPLAGGGDALAAASSFMRTEGIRRVKPVTFWSGVLTADASGNITHNVRLPDFQGALRIVAVANQGKAFGVGTAMTRVRTPLVLTPTLPRFLALGDTVEVPLTVRNDTPSAGQFQLNATVSGPAALGDVPARLTLETGQQKTVYLPLTCGKAEGKVEVTLTATGNDETATVSEELDQRAPLPVTRIMETGVLKGESGLVSAAAPNTLLPETVKRTVRLSVLPLMRFSGHLDNLLGYPYGCSEQTVSKAFPLLYFGSLAKQLAPGRFNTTGPAGLVHVAIRRLQTMQTSSGGYGYWPGAEADPWVSAYVCHFLLEAMQAGHTVPERMINRGLGYLTNLTNPPADAAGWDVERAAYALYVLALSKNPNLGSQDYLRETFGKNMKGVSRTLLAGAYFASGNPDAGFELLQISPAFDDGRPANGANLGSGLRDRALTALVLQAQSPDDPRLAGLTERISEELGKGRWYSTQETSLAFMALGKFLSTRNDDRPFAGTLAWPGQTRPFEETRTFTAEGILTSGEISLTKTPADRQVFFTALTAGAPKTETHRPLAQGLEVEQTLLREDGQPLDMNNVRQGELIVMRTRVRSTSGDLDNVVVQSLLPAGLEVENPRLATTERLDWMEDVPQLEGHQDLRDDRILVFASLRGDKWATRYSVLRAVTPGVFAMPPIQAEAMYYPDIRAAGSIGTLRVVRDEQQ